MCGKWLYTTLIAAFLFFVTEGNCLAAEELQEELIQKITDISAKTNTTVGITAIHIEKDEQISYNGSLPFIMGSTVKLPIAVVFLHHVDNNEADIDKVIQLRSEHLVPGSGILSTLFRDNILNISLRKLLKYMMTKSDNTATDAVLNQLSGPTTVFVRLKELGYDHIVITRTIMELFLATNDVRHMSHKKPSHLRRWEEVFNKIPLNKKTNAWRIFQDDIRDTATPDDMALLLKNLYLKRVLSESNTKYLLSLMEQCQTGRRRIKALLPHDVKVAHKSGTWAIYSQKFMRYPGARDLYRFAGDVGIITLPQNKGHIAIAIYVKSTAATNTVREKVIAEVAYEVFKYFNQ